MAALSAGTRNILVAEDTARGTPYAAEERKQRIAKLQATLQTIGARAGPLRQEGRRLISVGNVAGGSAKLEEALDADENAIAEAGRITMERCKSAARSARDLATLAKGRDAAKAVENYRRATALDPDDAQTWDDYAHAAIEVGCLAEAKAPSKGRRQRHNTPTTRFSAIGRHSDWATL